MIQLIDWIMSMDPIYVRIPVEVGYGFVAGFFLSIALYTSTKPLGGK